MHLLFLLGDFMHRRN